jgi:hypothetical protein
MKRTNSIHNTVLLVVFSALAGSFMTCSCQGEDDDDKKPDTETYMPCSHEDHHNLDEALRGRHVDGTVAVVHSFEW